MRRNVRSNIYYEGIKYEILYNLQRWFAQTSKQLHADGAVRSAGHLGDAVAEKPTVITTSTIKNVAKKPDLTNLYVQTLMELDGMVDI